MDKWTPRSRMHCVSTFPIWMTTHLNSMKSIKFSEDMYEEKLCAEQTLPKHQGWEKNVVLGNGISCECCELSSRSHFGPCTMSY